MLEGLSRVPETRGNAVRLWSRYACVGAFLATLELRLLVEELARYELAVTAEPAPPVPIAGGSFLGFERLDLTITPRAARAAAVGSGA